MNSKDNSVPQIYDFEDYRKYLHHLTKAKKKTGYTQAQFAEAIGCQAAYFSQVLKGRAQLTEEHVLNLSNFLSFQSEETHYFLLLLRLNKAGTPTLKLFLDQTRNEILAKRKELDNRINAKKKQSDHELTAYYSSDWLPAVIHVLTSCPDYQDKKSIAKRLSVGEELIEKHLQRLKTFDLIKLENNRFVYNQSSLHFSKGSPQDQLFQTTRRLLTLEKLKTRTEQDVHYSVLFATDKATRAKLKTKFMDFIESLHKEIEPTPSEEGFAIVLDLYRV